MLNILYITCLRDINQLNFSLKTLEICTDVSNLKLNLVVDDDECEEFVSKLKTEIKYNLIKHSELFSLIYKKEENFYKNTSGWHKQLLLKILYSKICQDKYYFIVDSDIIFYKKFKESDLFHENKYKNSYEIYPWSKMINDWINSAQNVLNYNLNIDDKILTTAPLIFDTDISKKLLDEIDPIWYFSGNNWSEYTLYSVYLHKINKYKQLYVELYVPINSWDLNLWNQSDITNDNLKYLELLKEKIHLDINYTGFSFALQSYVCQEYNKTIADRLYNQIYTIIYEHIFK